MKRRICCALIYGLISILLTACGGSSDGGGGGTTDTTAPGAVVMTFATISSGDLKFGWIEPDDADLALIRVGYKKVSDTAYINADIDLSQQPDNSNNTVINPDVDLDLVRYDLSITTIDTAGNETIVSFKLINAGNQNNYYFIYTAADLNAVRGGIAGYEEWDTLAAGFVLMADISLADYSAGAGWEPICNITTNFSKIFEGNGHTVSGLTIYRGADYQGLFGYIGTTGIVNDLGVTGSVSGKKYTGGLAGYNTGTISNCHAGVTIGVYPVIPAEVYSFFGGLVGRNYSGTIINCYATGSVTGGNSTGGLLGQNTYGGTVSDSYATGNVTSSGSDIGGLVGDNHGTSGITQITNCYATGNVTTNGGTNVGGLAGRNILSSGSVAIVTGCYATGSVSGTGESHGGLVGSNDNAEISLCYAKGNVSGSTYVGGLAGLNSGEISECYYYCYTVTPDYSVTGTTQSIGGFAGYNSGTISNSFSAAKTNVTTDVNNIGGFVGYNCGTIEYSCSTGIANATVSSTGKGDFVGTNNIPGTYTRCYYDSSKGVLGNTATGVTGLTTANMFVQANYTGWDFAGESDNGSEEIWTMLYNSYPHLSYLPNPYAAE